MRVRERLRGAHSCYLPLTGSMVGKGWWWWTTTLQSTGKLHRTRAQCLQRTLGQRVRCRVACGCRVDELRSGLAPRMMLLCPASDQCHEAVGNHASSPVSLFQDEAELRNVPRRLWVRSIDTVTARQLGSVDHWRAARRRSQPHSSLQWLQAAQWTVARTAGRGIDMNACEESTSTRDRKKKMCQGKESSRRKKAAGRGDEHGRGQIED